MTGQSVAPETQSAESTPRRVLMLAYWYPPVNESGAMRPFRFSKYLAEYGFQTLVVAASHAGMSDNSQNVIRTPEAGSRNRITAWMAGIGRGLQRLLPYKDCVEWVPHSVASASALIRDRKIPVILSTSPPLATHLSALWLKSRHPVKWIADFRDPLSGNPFRARAHGRVYDALIERSIVSRADAVIVNTDAALELLGNRYPKYRDKFHLIWNAYDPEDELAAGPVPSREYRLIAHFGSIYGGRHPGILLDSLQRLLRDGHLDASKIRVSLVGSLDHDSPWASKSAFKELGNIGCLEYTDRVLPRAEARKMMGECDFLLLLDLNEHMTGLQVPAKVFEYVRIGRPILTFTTRHSPAERILRQSGTRHVCIYPEDSPEEVDRKVLALLSMPTKPVQPSEWFARQFDAREQTKLLVQVLDSVITARG